MDPGKSSLLAHNVHEKPSPTYAEPKAGGRVSIGERIKASGFEEGYAREADRAGEAEFGEGEGIGSVCWTEREGRESLVLSVCACSERNQSYLRTLRETVWGSLTESTAEVVRWCAIRKEWWFVRP